MSEVSRTDRIWIAWETQRRTLSLSNRLGARLFILEFEHLGPLRYPVSLVRTAVLLWRYRLGTVFVQNPSLLLAAFAGALKPLLGYRLVVDRHSNFLLGDRKVGPWKRKLFHALSRFSIRRADLTLITNEEIHSRFIQDFGRGFILPDPYPELGAVQSPRTHGDGEPLEVLFVSTWQNDEPIVEAMEACRRLGIKVRLHITGKPKARYASHLERRPENFIPTGFVPDAEYFELMRRADCVMAISKWPSVLVCGAYEAVSLGKPAIVNDSRVTRDYFRRGFVYTDGTTEDLERALLEVSRRLPELRRDISAFRVSSAEAWEQRLQELDAAIQAIEPAGSRSRRPDRLARAA